MSNIKALKKYLLIGTAMLVMSACSSPKKVPYLVSAEDIPADVLKQQQAIIDPTLSPGDLLNIRVYSADAASVAPFNKGYYLTADGQLSQVSSQTTNSYGKENVTDFYLVNVNGDIDFPTLGTIHAAGKTKQQLADEIRNLIYPKYVRTPPTVEIRLMNFKVTVLGAVKNPGQYNSENERMNVLEALALAGDLDIRGDRENIMLYRTNADGSREVHRLNLHDRDLLLSPYFNLQQNDFIYVEPNSSMRQNSWQMHQGLTATITVIGGLSSLAGLVIGIINLNK